jgi:hypothetical protein
MFTACNGHRLEELVSFFAVPFREKSGTPYRVFQRSALP